MDCVNLNLDNLPTMDVDVINNLKKKVICEFQNLLKMLEKGYRLDYEFILEEISLIGLLEDKEIDVYSSLFVSQFYLNNKWETTLS